MDQIDSAVCDLLDSACVQTGGNSLWQVKTCLDHLCLEFGACMTFSLTAGSSPTFATKKNLTSTRQAQADPTFGALVTLISKNYKISEMLFKLFQPFADID